MARFLTFSLSLAAVSLLACCPLTAADAPDPQDLEPVRNVLRLFETSDIIEADVDADGNMETLFLRWRPDSEVAPGTFAVIDDDATIMLYLSDINGFNLFFGMEGVRAYAHVEERYRRLIVDAIDELCPACIEERERLISIRDAVVHPDLPPPSGLPALDNFEASLTEYWEMRIKLEMLGIWTHADDGNGCLLEAWATPAGTWQFTFWLLNEEEQPASDSGSIVYDPETATYMNWWEYYCRYEAEPGNEMCPEEWYAGAEARSTVVKVAVDEKRPLLPLRSVVEGLGGQVTWYAESRTALVRLASSQIVIRPGESEATNNGQVVSLSPPPKLANARLLVPPALLRTIPGVEVTASAVLGLAYVTLRG